MKTINILLLPFVLTGFIAATEQAEPFTTNTERFVSELEKRQESNVEFYGYLLEQFSRDCHLEDATLKQRYPNIDSLPVTPTEMLLILNSKHADGQTCLDIVQQKRYKGDLCARLAEGYEDAMELSKVLAESGKYHGVVFASIKKSELEEASIFAKERRLKKEADLDRKKTLSMLSKDIESAANENIVPLPVL